MNVKKLFPDYRPLFLNTIKYPRELRILVLAPHPDDFDEIGVTMRFFKENGNFISVAVVSSGASGVADNFCDPPTRRMKSEIREEEQRRSCQFFGLPQSHLTFLRCHEDEDGHPAETQENLERIRRCFLEEQWNIVFLPHGNDTNPGHRRTYTILRKIIAQTDCPNTILLNRDPKTIRMRFDLFTPFGTAEALWKAQLLRFHESQHHRNLHTRNHGFDERVLRVNRETASRFLPNSIYAEAFEIEFWGY